MYVYSTITKIRKDISMRNTRWNIAPFLASAESLKSALNISKTGNIPKINMSEYIISTLVLART